MAAGLNRVQLIGTLGADPELRSTQSGLSVLNLRMATNERFKDRDGEWKERTDWHSCCMFGKRAEALNSVLAKGSSIFVEGSLRTSSYEKNGEKRYRTEIVIQDVILLGGRNGGGRGSDDDDRRGAAPDYDESLPF